MSIAEKEALTYAHQKGYIVHSITNVKVDNTGDLYDAFMAGVNFVSKEILAQISKMEGKSLEEIVTEK